MATVIGLSAYFEPHVLSSHLAKQCISGGQECCSQYSLYGKSEVFLPAFKEAHRHTDLQ